MNDEPPPARAPVRLTVSVAVDPALTDIAGPSALPDASFIETHALLALADAPERAIELSVRLVARDEGRTLNRDWRGIDRATNVLSFPADMPALDDSRHLGDLVFCVPVIEAEASSRGLPRDAHWAHLIVHGTLHLLGHDHLDDAAASAMEALEVGLLARAGIADPYRLDASADAADRTDRSVPTGRGAGR